MTVAGRRRWLSAILGAALAAATVGACGGDDGDAAPRDDPPASTTTAEPTETAVASPGAGACWTA
ncbi:MAG TPA: hypothetical protein VJM49_00760, partial [Acidimicrobiales bacterium]|nr:hypothetical protein [Acidimicrobiales bacterium]